MKALGALYVETMLQSANFYDEIAVQTIGRSPAHVLLLHETDLATGNLIHFSSRRFLRTLAPKQQCYRRPAMECFDL